jgi:hypothetical protein
MKSQVTSSQWEKVNDKYGNLIYTICHNISGDPHLCAINDLKADLHIITLEAIETYGRKTNQTFDEFFETEVFGKYLKTCLWNYKNNRGAKITKKRKIRNMPSIDAMFSEEDFNTLEVFTDPKSCGGESLELQVEDFKASLDENQKQLISQVVDNPELIKANGKINCLGLSVMNKKPYHAVKSDIKDISKILGIEL